MEDFEYSVEICDRDWQCFFAECEECNLLPPSLAGLDDSGMSDFDESRSHLARSPQRIERTAGLSDTDHSMACSPECPASPADHYLSRYGLGGMESILSGSEEDLHLQTVNMFFERMKSYSEAESVPGPREEEPRGAGEVTSSSSSSLPKSPPRFSSPPASGETTETVGSISSINKARKLWPDPVCRDGAADSLLQTSSLPELLIVEESWSEHEATPQAHTPLWPRPKQPEDRLSAEICSSKLGDLSWPTNAEALENPSSSYSGTSSPNRSLSQESSPSSSIKRKRRKRRRLSIEPAEGVHACDRPSDSEEDQCAWRAGRAAPGDICWAYWGETQRKPPPACCSSSLRVMTPGTPSSAETKCPTSHLTENAATSDRLLDLPDDSGMSNLSPPDSDACRPQVEKHVSCLGSVSAGESHITAPQEETKLSNTENSEKLKDDGMAEVESVTCSVFPSPDWSAAAACQNDKQSTAAAVLALEAAPPGTHTHTLCNGEAEPERRVEITCHNREPVWKDGGKSPSHVSLPSQTAESSLRSPAEENSPCGGSVHAPSQEVQHPLVPKVLSEQATPKVLPNGDIPGAAADVGAAGSRDEGAASLAPLPVITPPQEKVLDVLGCSSVALSGSVVQAERPSSLSCVTQKGGGAKGQSCDPVQPQCGAEEEGAEVIVASEAKKPPDLKPSVFAMSSFWSEMEKLTINDIMGLRMTSKAVPPPSPNLPPPLPLGPLEPLQEAEESVFVRQQDEPQQPSAEVKATSLASSGLSAVLWDSEPGADIYPRTTLTSVGDLSQPVHPLKAQSRLRKISKNISMHNLPALESQPHNYQWKGQPLHSLDGGELEKMECFSNGHVLKQDKEADCLGPAAAGSYRISLTDIFQYIFGGKESAPSPPAVDEAVGDIIDGSSVPESYDHFFSEFDTESFFYPLIKSNNENETVPIFSCSRSTNLQFPEVYDQFFPSSSDTSSDEEDEESGQPLRVITRFNRQRSSPQICTDVYDNFFSDSEVRQNFFWKTTLSLRNVLFSGSGVATQQPEPLTGGTGRNCGRALHRTLPLLNVLGNQDAVFADPLLSHLDQRISRQLSKPALRYEDFQRAVPNPRLDAPLLPLKQSDMCLVCIAFASWVLKTANPQVGDTWKAVLLANVSALSAIRYLRKHVKAEAAGGQKKLQLPAPPSS